MTVEEIEFSGGGIVVALEGKIDSEPFQVVRNPRKPSEQHLSQ